MKQQVRTTQDLGHAIRKLRRSKQMTQNDLAKRANVSQKWISDVESAKSGLRLVNVLVLLDALDVDLVLKSRDVPAVDLDELLGLGGSND